MSDLRTGRRHGAVTPPQEQSLLDPTAPSGYGSAAAGGATAPPFAAAGAPTKTREDLEAEEAAAERAAALDASSSVNFGGGGKRSSGLSNASRRAFRNDNSDNDSELGEANGGGSTKGAARRLFQSTALGRVCATIQKSTAATIAAAMTAFAAGAAGAGYGAYSAISALVGGCHGTINPPVIPIANSSLVLTPATIPSTEETCYFTTCSIALFAGVATAFVVNRLIDKKATEERKALFQ